MSNSISETYAEKFFKTVRQAIIDNQGISYKSHTYNDFGTTKDFISEINFADNSVFRFEDLLRWLK